MNKANKKARPVNFDAVAGRYVPLKIVKDLAGNEIGAVTDFTDGTFLGYIKAIGYGEYLASAEAAEAFIVDGCKALDADD